MCRLIIFQLQLLFCPLITAAAETEGVTHGKDGTVVIDAAVFQPGDDGGRAVTFTATRWGMYKLLAKPVAPARLAATVDGHRPRRPGGPAGDGLGTYYIEREGPCEIALQGELTGVSAIALVPACEGAPVLQTPGKAIELDAKDCRIEGVMLRYEPDPKKRCIGFWGNADDVPVWDFTVVTPGEYEVVLTQGCGRGDGGSRAVLETGGASFEFAVEDTGGYQNWLEKPLGTVRFDRAGRNELRVRVLKKSKGIMDIRRIVLKPVRRAD
jgi:hypothetical protein